MMQAIRKTTTITHSTIAFDELATFDNRRVDVIVLPEDEDFPSDTAILRHSALLKFGGAVSSGFTDTSERVDELLYGK